MTFFVRLFKTHICILIALLAMGFSAASRADGTLHFATEASHPPFESIDQHGKFVGFDIDLAKAICQKMRTHCVFSDQPFDSLLASIEFGRYDAAISAINVTENRAKRVDFTQPYMVNGAMFIAKKGRFSSHYQFRGERVAVQNGSAEQRFLLAYYVSRGTTIVPYATYPQAFKALQTGQVDGLFLDAMAAQYWVKQHPAYEIVGAKVTTDKYFGTGCAIAVNSDNKALLKQFNAALAQLKRSGEYQRIADRYFRSGNVLSD